MDYLIGWGLLLAFVALLVLLIRVAGGRAIQVPRATCGLEGCCRTRPPRPRS